MRMLEKEGFVYDRYVDIFDGGPTMTIATDEIATIRNAREETIVAVGAAGDEAVQSLVAVGRFAAFRACVGRISPKSGGILLDHEAANALGVTTGDLVTQVAR